MLIFAPVNRTHPITLPGANILDLSRKALFIFCMEYNTTRDKLLISEYGRNVQNMIRMIAAIDEREKRTKLAHALVSVLAAMHPEVRDHNDLRHKLWDHLYIMSEFTLDVDCPFPIPPKPEQVAIPNHVAYSQSPILLRPYGKNMERIIQTVCEMEEGEEKESLIRTIGNTLKKMYLNWNRDSVNDALIHEHLSLLSNGMLKMKDEDRLHSTNDLLKTNRPPANKKAAFKKEYPKDFNAKKRNNNGKNRRKS